MIKKDSEIIKSGEDIGMAGCDIQPGDHVHTHNVIDTTFLQKKPEKGPGWGYDRHFYGIRTTEFELRDT